MTPVGNTGASSRQSCKTSESLLDQLRAQQSDAWQRLTDLYGPLVYYWCRRQGLDSEDSRDVYQEVFAAVASKIRDFRYQPGKGSFRGWLWTVALNKIRDHYRKQAVQPHAAGGTTAQRRMAAFPEQFPDQSTADADHRALDDLHRRGLEMVRAEFEPQTWEAFWRVTVEGHTTSEVAVDLGISANGVRQAKSRVLRRLRERLGDMLE